jgi:hypothetical protein
MSTSIGLAGVGVTKDQRCANKNLHHLGWLTGGSKKHLLMRATIERRKFQLTRTALRRHTNKVDVSAHDQQDGTRHTDTLTDSQDR